MKSGEKLPPRVHLPQREDSCQFQQFKDEQFTSHRLSQLHCKRKMKTINSLSVYTIASLPTEGVDQTLTDVSLPLPPPLPPPQNYPAKQQQPSPLVIEPKMITQPRRRKKQFTVLRYSRNEGQGHTRGSQLQLTPQEKELLKSNEKIQLIRKILDLYNAKSVQRAYYSNLISPPPVKSGQNTPGTTPTPTPTPTPNTSTPQQQRNKSVTIKKLPPKGSFRNAFRKCTQTTTNQTLLRIGQLNMHGFDLAEEYYNHSSITLEAQGMNELIKDFLERKRMNRSAENSSSLGKKKAKSNQELLMNGKESKFPRKNMGKYETLSQIKAKLLQNMSDNSVNHKVNKFRQFLFMINFANGVYRQLDINKYQQPFRVYIGKGNNSNLIKSIFKKRFWFEVTKNREEAHFVWTQLKEEGVYARQVMLKEEMRKERLGQGQGGKKEREKERERVTEEELMNDLCEDLKQVGDTNHTGREEGAQSSLMTIEKPTQQQGKIKSPTKSRLKKVEFNSTQMKLLTAAQNMEYNAILGQFVIRKKYKFSDRLKYMRDVQVLSNEQMRSDLMHNHLPLNGLLGNKKAMFYMLREYYRLTNRSIFQTVPLTYHIKKGFLDEEFKAFMLRFQQESKEGKNYWIIKPGQFSNRGQGITCTDKFQDIRLRISNLRKLGRNKSLILQKYITNPLLYNNRKFDIRTYMLLTTNNGTLRGYWYQDGYIRTSSSIWTLDSINDTFAHLTNDAIQKHSSTYGKFQPGNKLTYSELQRYLDGLKMGKVCNFQTDIYPLLKEIATDAIRATSVSINPLKNSSNFEIFGFDFMIDANFKPWLIEINTNPCLQMSCPVLERIIPSMVQNAFRIAVDPIFPPPMNFSSTYKYTIPENALHYNKFELIFDQQRDGGELRELYAGNNIVETIDEFQEDKETYEEEGEELALLEP